MTDNRRKIIGTLIDYGLELRKRPREKIPFSMNDESDKYLNDIETYPHFFVLGCVMDRQIKAWRAWLIPYKISQMVGGTDFSDFFMLDLPKTIKIFNEQSLHRMPTKMAHCFYDALQKIHDGYSDNAGNIWKQGQPSSQEVIDRFAQFNGVGQKISTMATNILVREFKVPLRDTSSIDISVDIQIDRVFKRLGLVPISASKDEIIQSARALYPQYPGVFDSVCWEIGEAWCKPEHQQCEKCFMNEYCPKIV
jgi:endonuclease III